MDRRAVGAATTSHIGQASQLMVTQGVPIVDGLTSLIAAGLGRQSVLTDAVLAEAARAQSTPASGGGVTTMMTTFLPLPYHPHPQLHVLPPQLQGGLGLFSAGGGYASGSSSVSGGGSGGYVTPSGPAIMGMGHHYAAAGGSGSGGGIMMGSSGPSSLALPLLPLAASSPSPLPQ